MAGTRYGAAGRCGSVVGGLDVGPACGQKLADLRWSRRNADRGGLSEV